MREPVAYRQPIRQAGQGKEHRGNRWGDVTASFTGDVSETTDLHLENHVGWDSKPFGAGAALQARKSPRMLAIEQKRVPSLPQWRSRDREGLHRSEDYFADGE